MTDVPATQIVILGGGGDLSKRKLLPALLDLYTRDLLPQPFHIIGLARSPRSSEEYRTFVTNAVNTHSAGHQHSEETIASFCSNISYVAGSFDEPETYTKLQVVLDDFDHSITGVSNRLFYLAVPPKYYGSIFTDLKETGLAREDGGSWTHILVEKPFGHNLETAQALDTKLASLYREDQIFRIDHYLAKEAVQNILSFRFANTLLQTPWNKKSVESVTITMSETIDVGERADFYEGIGALRDVGQNHLLQLLALTAMREPTEFTADAIRRARTEALQALEPMSGDALAGRALRAQYNGYRVNDSIPDDSETETYFELQASIGMPEWEGVPFYIRSGKALDTDEVSITVRFKDVATGMFETKTCLSVGNEVKLTISPEQTISVTLNAKAPGLGFQLETRTLSFTCAKGSAEIKNAYEKVLYDSIIGDQTLFTTTEEVLAAWRFITPVLESWHDQPLRHYEKGSAGPSESIIPSKHVTYAERDHIHWSGPNGLRHGCTPQ